MAWTASQAWKATSRSSYVTANRLANSRQKRFGGIAVDRCMLQASDVEQLPDDFGLHRSCGCRAHH